MAEAFKGVRGELALLRRAIQGIAARVDRPEPVDYSDTLGQLTKPPTATYQRGEILRKAAEEETVARRVAAGITGAVAVNRQAVKTAAAEMRDATRALQGVTVSARSDDEQNRCLTWTASGQIAAGMILWAMAGEDGGAHACHANVGGRPAHDADRRTRGFHQHRGR